MGKRIDELKGLDDAPIEAPEEPDRRETTWGRFLQEIDDLLSDPEYNWAGDTLRGIYDSVERKRFVTEGQRTAIANIAAGGRRSRGRSRPNYFGKYQGR